MGQEILWIGGDAYERSYLRTFGVEKIIKEEKMKRFIVPLLTAVMVVSIIFAGCMPAAAPPVTPPPVTPPPVTPPPVTPPEEVEPIKVGVGTAVTGVLADDGRHHVRALEIARDEINAVGGLLGRPVELVVVDIGDCTPPELVSARDTLKAADVDVVNSNWFKLPQAMTFLLEVGVLTVHHGWVSSDWDQWWAIRDEYPYYMCLNEGEQGYGIPYFQGLMNPEMITWEYPNKTVAIQTCDTLYTLRQENWWIGEAERQGWEIVYRDVHAIGTAEFGPHLAKIRALDPAPAIVWMNSVISEEVIPFFAEFLEDPTQSLFIITWMIEKPEFLGAFGEVANGVVGTLPGFHFHASEYTGQNQQYRTHYHLGKTLGAEYRQRYGEEPSVQVPIAYDSFWIWADAVARVGDVRDFEAIQQAMIDHPYVGATARYAFDPETHACTYAVDAIPINYFQVQGGEVYNLAIGSGMDVEIIDPFVLPYWLEE